MWSNEPLLCLAFFCLPFTLFAVVLLSLLVCIVGRCRVICERLETQRYPDLVGLFKANGFLHRHGRYKRLDVTQLGKQSISHQWLDLERVRSGELVRLLPVSV